MITEHTAESLIAFEHGTRDDFAAGILPFLVHLSGGNEAQLLEIFADVQPEDWIFSTHRNHYHALLKGIPAGKLRELIRDGNSMFVFDKARNFFTSSILAGTCGIAAGVAWQIKAAGESAKVFCFLGDGATDNGHLYEAAKFVEAHGLPCTFIIEDNDRSVDTPKSGRYPKEVPGLDELYYCVKRYTYAPTFAHGGANLPPSSVKFKPEIVAKFARP